MTTTGNSETARPSRRLWILDAAIILTAFVLLCVRAQDQPLSQTALSRLATVQALSQDGAWYIDRPPDQPANPFETRTIDKVQIDGRLLSSKPPLLPWLMALEYRVLKTTLGGNLENLADTKRVLYAFTLTFCILPWTLALVAAAALLRAFVGSAAGRALALASLAFGTQVFGFGSVFNNHVPAAAALVIAIALTAAIGAFPRRAPVLAATAGLFGGLVAAFDVPNTAYVAALGLLLLMSRPRSPAWIVFGAAAAVPVLAQSWLLYQSTGSPLPVQMRPETYLYESAYWRNPLGVDALEEPKGIYLFNMTFGNRGVFVLYPVLLTGVIGLAMALSKHVPGRVGVVAGGACVTIVIAYYTLYTANYGGEVYGMRWLIPSMAVLVLMGIPAWNTMDRRGPMILAIMALALSVYSAWQCGSTPWTAGEEWTRHTFGF